ncbi:OmpA family protein [Palleronia sp. LCG004]|uniref:OmpA family protein n=1 Tax=Palleronia sp. LCG004 TaxID=3079304 RepID=UPI002943CEF5|nr:OmpA family protein [Palleronia sp. LCG004]WOI55692.1 OmpA family protein [Palleronia sp. LCG004]
MVPARPLLIFAALTLAACADRPAGTELDPGTYGNATANNFAVQSGRIGQVEGLNNRFSTEIDPVVTFPFDSAALDAQARATIARQARWIRQFPEARFQVFGHTDLVGSAAYNEALGLRRAQAVLRELVANGVDASRLSALVSFGERQPLIVTQGRERANRRTVTEVAGFTSGRGQLLNGKYAEVIFREYVASAAAGEQSLGAEPPATTFPTD